jgi:hypothetical protein
MAYRLDVKHLLRDLNDHLLLLLLSLLLLLLWLYRDQGCRGSSSRHHNRNL